MLIESTYGNRVHPHEDAMADLAPALQRAAARSGVVVIPVFAVGRAQAILAELAPALQRSAASDALHWKIEHELGWRARVPDHLSVWPL